MRGRATIKATLDCDNCDDCDDDDNVAPGGARQPINYRPVVEAGLLLHFMIIMMSGLMIMVRAST